MRDRVLVVDHNADSRDSLTLLLGYWGYEVRTASSGPEALQVAEVFNPNVILSEVVMPRRDGLWLARQLRVKFPDTMVVAFTGLNDTVNRRRIRKAGYHHHLVKGDEPAALFAVLAECCRDRPQRCVSRRSGIGLQGRPFRSKVSVSHTTCLKGPLTIR